MAEQRPIYYFINGSVNLLVVDDDPRVLKILNEKLAPLSLYSVKCAPDSRTAVELLESPERFHVCVADLGLKDKEDDEFYLLKRFHRHVSFVILTGASSPRKGFLAAKHGAKALMEKSGELDYGSFVRMLNRYALLNIINPRYQAHGKDPLSVSTRVLFEKSPTFVTDWALEMGVTDREIRHIWKRNLGANAKIILFMYQLFRGAFTYYEHFLEPDFDGADTAVPEDYRRREEYYHCHRSTICDYIAFGNVVNFT